MPQLLAQANPTIAHVPSRLAAPAFSVLKSNIVGRPGTTGWIETNAVGAAVRFYRVRLE